MAVKRLESDFLEKVKVPVEAETLTGSNLYKFLKYRIWIGEVPPTEFLMEGDIWRQPLVGQPDAWLIRNNDAWETFLATEEESGLMSATDKAALNDVVVKNTAGDRDTEQIINSKMRFYNDVTIEENDLGAPFVAIADGGTFTTDTYKGWLRFPGASSQGGLSSDAGAIMHEITSITWPGTHPDNDRSVLHLIPSDNAGTQDYVAVSTFPPGVSTSQTNIKFWTGGLIECVSVNTTSAREKKTNIVPTSINATEYLSKIDVVDFKFKEGFGTGEQRIGFIADDTDSLVSGIEQNQMDHANLLGVLIKANQELAARIKELEDK